MLGQLVVQSRFMPTPTHGSRNYAGYVEEMEDVNSFIAESLSMGVETQQAHGDEGTGQITQNRIESNEVF